jgi:hypothetical protein
LNGLPPVVMNLAALDLAWRLQQGYPLSFCDALM